MLPHEHKQRVLAKLRNACSELEDALNFSVPVARYDPVVIPQGMRNQISVMIDDLNRILRDLESMQ
jgi:hypothetical protein